MHGLGLALVMRNQVHLYRVRNADVGEIIELLAVLSIVLACSDTLSPYRDVKMPEREIPLSGMTGRANIGSCQHTAGMNLPYLPKYILSSKPLS